VLAMLGARILAPHTKLATTRWWHTTTLAEEFGVVDADEDDLYAAMDWLLARQDAIQNKLAARHLREGGLVLYDLSSSYFEGTTCALAKLGHNRDGKSGLLQVNYGLLTDARGCPVAVSVYEGNVSDSKTLMPEVKRLREDFGIERFVLVGHDWGGAVAWSFAMAHPELLSQLVIVNSPHLYTFWRELAGDPAQQHGRSEEDQRIVGLDLEEKIRKPPRGDPRHGKADQNADGGELGPFSQHETQHLAALRSERRADPELVPALG